MRAVSVGAILAMGVSAGAFAVAVGEGAHLLGRAFAVLFIAALALLTVSVWR